MFTLHHSHISDEFLWSVDAYTYRYMLSITSNDSGDAIRTMSLYIHTHTHMNWGEKSSTVIMNELSHQSQKPFYGEGALIWKSVSVCVSVCVY